jgi:CRP/FNR family transcriptional regulator
MITIAQLRQIDFFSSLNEKQLLYLQTISTVRTFVKNTIVYYESDIDYSLQFLLDGTIKIYKVDKHGNEIFMYYIYKNDMISELTSIDSQTIYCFSNASFVENGAILSIDFKEFKKYFLDTGLLSSQFIKEVLNKSHQLQCILNRELVFDSTAKVAHMICTNLEMFNSLKKTQIAFMLHIQPETLSRVLKRFSRDDLIVVQNKQYVINNEEQLTSIFKGIGL